MKNYTKCVWRRKVVEEFKYFAAEEYPEEISENQINDIPFESLQKLYITMLRIRIFEEKVTELLFKNEIRCPTHLYNGQEAIATGVCINLNRNDYVFSTHRSHGHYIAKGGDLKMLMAELYGRSDGCSGGKGGSMHIIAQDVGFMGSSAIVGGNLPLAAGTALASKIREDGRVTVVFFGDGATDEGVFHETLNFSALYKLPILFICENNFFSTHLPLFLRQPADNLVEKVSTYLIPAVRVFGNNVLEIYKTAQILLKDVRSGKGPAFIECRTFRWKAHVGPWDDLDVGYRKKKIVEEWKRRCPIKMLENLLSMKGLLKESERVVIRKEIQKEVEEAIVYAKENPFPDDESEDDVFAI